MNEEFHSMELSLREFLSEAQSDNYNSASANLYKYNNLKIYMEPKRFNIPHFIIRIGISESVYDIEKGEKIHGGLGVNERYVKRWLDRNMSKIDFGMAWKNANRVKVVSIKQEEDNE